VNAGAQGRAGGGVSARRILCDGRRVTQRGYPPMIPATVVTPRSATCVAGLRAGIARGTPALERASDAAHAARL
jgi:hypothetical protein